MKQQSKLLIGDSINILPTIANDSVDCIITSPPYWGLRDYGIDNQLGLEATLDEYLLKLEKIFIEINRVLKSDGTFWLNIGDCYTSGNRKYRAPDKKNTARHLIFRPDNPVGLKNKDLVGLPWRLAFKLQELGWYLRSDIIWQKPNSMPESVKDRVHRNHEYLFLLSKSEKYYFDNNELLKNVNTNKSVWCVKQSKFNGNHFATFPIDLVIPCILSSTKKGGVVLDPFCGSGTVGIACKELNRNFIGIDINPDFIEMTKTRLGI